MFPDNINKNLSRLGWLLPHPSALKIGVGGNLIEILLAMPLLAIPAGTYVKLMLWAGLAGIVAVGTAVTGLPLAVVNMVYGRSKVRAILAAVLSLTPGPLAILLMHAAAAIKGFHLAG